MLDRNGRVRRAVDRQGRNPNVGEGQVQGIELLLVVGQTHRPRNEGGHKDHIRRSNDATFSSFSSTSRRFSGIRHEHLQQALGADGPLEHAQRDPTP